MPDELKREEGGCEECAAPTTNTSGLCDDCINWLRDIVEMDATPNTGEKE